MPLQLPQVLGSAVSFMRKKSVLGIVAVRPDHEPVAEDLRNDRGRRNGATHPIAFDHGPLLRRDPRKTHRIKKEVIWTRDKVTNRLGHRQTSGLQDVQRINRAGIHHPHADVHSDRQQLGIDLFALPLTQELGISYPVQSAPTR